ncbi:MAG: hypothetical protein KatS3mg002_0299 [Candidatus Woesearchaeota archaeon]|nr:MAG: hypothetical protein KatS3mg002_0299 [Candidatus Woesearchaeota archaeon]
MNTFLIEFYYNLGKAEMLLEKAPPNLKLTEGLSAFRKLLSVFSRMKADAIKAGVSKDTIKRAEALVDKAKKKKVAIKENLEMLNEGLVGTIIWELIKYAARAILIVATGWAIVIIGTALFPPGIVLFTMLSYGVWTIGLFVNFLLLIYNILKKATTDPSQKEDSKIETIQKSIELIDKTIKDYNTAISKAQKEGASAAEIEKMKRNLTKLEEKKKDLMQKVANLK